MPSDSYANYMPNRDGDIVIREAFEGMLTSNGVITQSSSTSPQEITLRTITNRTNLGELSGLMSVRPTSGPTDEERQRQMLAAYARGIVNSNRGVETITKDDAITFKETENTNVFTSSTKDFVLVGSSSLNISDYYRNKFIPEVTVAASKSAARKGAVRLSLIFPRNVKYLKYGYTYQISTGSADFSSHLNCQKKEKLETDFFETPCDYNSGAIYPSNVSLTVLSFCIPTIPALEDISKRQPENFKRCLVAVETLASLDLKGLTSHQVTAILAGLHENADIEISGDRMLFKKPVSADTLDFNAVFLNCFNVAWDQAWARMGVTASLRELHDEREALLESLGVSGGATPSVLPEVQESGTRKIRLSS